MGIGRSPFANGLECQTRTLKEFNGFSSEKDGSQMNAQSSRGREPKPIKGWPGSDNTTQIRPVDQTPSVTHTTRADAYAVNIYQKNLHGPTIVVRTDYVSGKIPFDKRENESNKTQPKYYKVITIEKGKHRRSEQLLQYCDWCK